MQPFSNPSDATHKTGPRDIQVQKCKNFVIQDKKLQIEYSDPVRNQIRPTFYVCPGYKQIDDDSSKMNELAWRLHFFHYKVMGKSLDAKGQLTP